jgi:putative flippase GtrA
MNTKTIVQIFKYGVVGILNTLLTAVVIALMMHFVFLVKGNQGTSAIAVSVSNITGYLTGYVNSFIWNRRWTFHSRNNWKVEFLKFSGVFLLCYIPQLSLVMTLNRYANIPTLDFRLWTWHYVIASAYLCQLAGIVFYTVLNFLCNKYYTFKN